MRYSQVVGPRRSAVVDVPDPVAGPGQVLVRAQACGVCASDREAWSAHSGPEPKRLGHEVTGTVVATGNGASRWRPGDRVTGFGGPGYAELVVLDATRLLAVPAGLDAEAALGEPLACQAEAFLRTPLKAGDRAVVVGLGYMGLGFLQMARLRGPSALVGVDLSLTAREAALALGADEAYHPDELPESYASSSNASPALDPRFQVVVEATGSAAGLELAGKLTAPDGALVVLGYHASGPRLLDLALWYKSVTIINGYTPNRARLMDALSWGLRMLGERRITYAPLITHRFGLDGVDAAFELFDQRPPGFIKAVISP